MKRIFTPILFALIIFFSCEEKEDPVTACGISDPIENLAWLAELKEATATGPMSEYSSIVQAKYNGQTVFYVGMCCPNCNTFITLFDCYGNALEGDLDLNLITGKKVIWHPEITECLFI